MVATSRYNSIVSIAATAWPQPAARRHLSSAPGGSGDRVGFLGDSLAVEPFAHFLAGLEERHALLFHRNVLPGARIAAGAGGAMLHRERAETTQLHAIAARERRDNLIEDGIHDVLDIPLIEMRVMLGDTLSSDLIIECRIRDGRTAISLKKP
jgi:hypothetical protein